MNNSKLAIDSVSLTEEQPVDVAPQLKDREGKLIKIIEALQSVNQSQAWSTLKTEVFDSIVNILEKEIKDEAKKETPDTLKLNRFAGQLKWAEKYSDLYKLENVFRQELTHIRTKINGTESNGQ